MEILHLRMTVGPNLYSTQTHKLIVARIRLAAGETEQTLQAAIENALNLQNQALNLDLNFQHIRPLTDKGCYSAVFESPSETIGSAALRASVFGETETSNIHARLQTNWTAQWGSAGLRPLIQEATRRGIPHLPLNGDSLIQLGYGCQQQRIKGSITELTSQIGLDIASDRALCSRLLRSMDMPATLAEEVYHCDDLQRSLRKIDFPIVMSLPLKEQLPTVVLDDWETASAVLEMALKRVEHVLVEPYISGHDYQVLMVSHKFTAAALCPGVLVEDDDGVNLAKMMTKAATQRPKRGAAIKRLHLSLQSVKWIGQHAYELQQVLQALEQLNESDIEEFSAASAHMDVSVQVHPDNVALFERVSRFIGLDVCGIQLRAEGLDRMLVEQPGKILRVLAAPDLSLNDFQSKSAGVNVYKPVIDQLFPNESTGRIPVIAITGTNGKTTTTRLVAHLMNTAGRKVGFTSSDGVYVQGFRIQEGDCTGEQATWTLLKDPEVDTAVLEYPRGGIIRAGLGFDQCDVGVVLNVAADHLGTRDIHTIEEMAEVKAVVAKSVCPQGFAVLNADDDLVYGMRHQIQSKAALFSLDAGNARLEESEFRCFVRDGELFLARGSMCDVVAKLPDIPITFGGQALFNVQNVMAASLAAYCHGLSIGTIRRALMTFDPGLAGTPGRMNFFYGDRFRVLVDYAHNAASMLMLKQFLDRARTEARRVGVLGGTGDRLDKDIMEIGSLATDMFDLLIIREDRDLRGREAGETAALVEAGVRANASPIPTKVILDPMDAVRFAIENAQTNDLICILGGDVEDSLNVVREYCRSTR
ncbi:MAG: Mur ligase family protein [Pseudomonadota bacterium]